MLRNCCGLLSHQVMFVIYVSVMFGKNGDGQGIQYMKDVVSVVVGPLVTHPELAS